MKGLDPMSDLFAKVAKVVEPAVVEVRVTKRITVRQVPDILRQFFGDGHIPPGFEESFPARQYVESGLGSGIIVDAENGYIVTNNHVVAGADEVQVVLADGRHIMTQWIRTDPRTDLAVVKIDASDLIQVPLGDSHAMQVGDWVLAIGAPEGLQKTVTAGIISAKGRVRPVIRRITRTSFRPTPRSIPATPAGRWSTRAARSSASTRRSSRRPGSTRASAWRFRPTWSRA